MRPIAPLARWFVLCAAASVALAACKRSPEPPSPPPPPASSQASAPPTLAVIDRTGLLRALDTARSAYAAGRADLGADLAGRRFVVRQAFGCSGATPRNDPPEPGLAAWGWGPKDRTIELTLQPADWRLWAQAGQVEPPLDAVEGFWLDRPWLRADGCPASQVAASPATEDAPSATALAAPRIQSRQTAGLAAVFERGGSRVGRRDGKAFTYTIRGDDGPPVPPAAGYNLVLEGRFTAFPGGRAIRCRAAGPDEPPVCIAAASVDRVAFETLDGQVLSEWRAG